MPPLLPSKAPALALLAVALCTAGATRAATPLPLELEWSAPLECPTGEQVERELTRITRIRAGRTLVPLHARAQIIHNERDYRLVLQIERSGELSQANFDSNTCAPLRKAATLVLALAFGDGVELQSEPGPESPTTPDTSPAAPPASTPRDRDATPAPPETKGIRLVPWVGGALASGFIGDSTLGVDLGFGLGGRFWNAFARGGAIPPSTAATREGVSAVLSSMNGALGACAGYPFASARLDACVALEAALVRAHSNGALRDGSATAPSFAIAPALAAFFPIARPFALRAELALLLPFQSAHYDVAPFGTLYASSPIIPRGALGLAVEL